MSTQSLLNKGLIEAISEIIAKAAMSLPALEKQNDMFFISMVAGDCIRAFWENYAVTCDLSEQNTFYKLIKDKNEEDFYNWVEKNADFDGNIEHRRKADMVLEDLAMRLPEILIQSHSQFRNEIA